MHQDLSHQLQESLQHNRQGQLSPAQQQRLKQRSRNWLLVALASAAVTLGAPLGAILLDGGRGESFAGGVFIASMGLGVFVYVFWRWWQLETDLESGMVDRVDGEINVRVVIKEMHDGNTRDRTFMIGHVKLDDELAEGLHTAGDGRVRGYYTPRTKLLVAVEPLD